MTRLTQLTDVAECQARDRLESLIAVHGPWTTNIWLGGNLFTQGHNKDIQADRFRHVLQIVADLAGKPLSDLRVLDLACLEGAFSIEFALQGATVVAVEGRHTNIEKARFVKEYLSLRNLEFVEDDMRNVRAERYGSFDAVFCMGILYHLNAPDVFQFLEHLRDMTRLVILDTHLSPKAEISCTYRGNAYWGRTYQEYPDHWSASDIEKAPWSSIDNAESFWLTRSSLYNLLSDIGFTSVYQCLIPRMTFWGIPHRTTLVAVKGRVTHLRSVPPDTPVLFAPRYTEEETRSPAVS